VSDLSINRAVRYAVQAGIYSNRRRPAVTASGPAEWLARFLSPAARDRLMPEVMGDLGACESRWARARYLLGIAVRLPGLLWIIRRRKP
jgi:hypothetical protein